MAIFLGNQEFLSNTLFFGGNAISEVYYGPLKIWPVAGSYMLPDGLRHAEFQGSLDPRIVETDSEFVLTFDFRMLTDAPDDDTWLFGEDVGVAWERNAPLVDWVVTVGGNDAVYEGILANCAPGEWYTATISRPETSDTVTVEVAGIEQALELKNNVFTLNAIYARDDGGNRALKADSGMRNWRCEDVTLGNVWEIALDEGAGLFSEVLLNGVPYTFSMAWNTEDWA